MSITLLWILNTIGDEMAKVGEKRMGIYDTEYQYYILSENGEVQKMQSSSVRNRPV